MALLAVALQDGSDVFREGHLRCARGGRRALLGADGRDSGDGDQNGGEPFHRNLLAGPEGRGQGCFLSCPTY